MEYLRPRDQRTVAAAAGVLPGFGDRDSADRGRLTGANIDDIPGGTASATIGAVVAAGTVAAIETVRVGLLPNPRLLVRGARGAHDRSDFLLVRVHTSGGAVGHGEVSATPRWSGEDDVSAEHFIREILGPAVIGQPLWPVPDLGARMDRALAGNPFTKAGLDIALWDALGRTLGHPVVELLGGPFRTSVPIKMSLSGDGRRLEEVVGAAVGLGVRAFKVKVGLALPTDLVRVARTRDLVGPDVLLGADANGGWSRAEAVSALPALRELGVAFLEQPVAADDVEGMAAVRAAARPLGIAVMADEAVYSMADLVRLADAGAADLFNVYVGKAAGMERAVRQLDAAAAMGLGGIIGSNGEMGLGAAAQIHVACAARELASIPSDIIGQLYYDEDILVSPLPIDGTVATLPDGPGLGVEPSPAISRRFH